MNSFEQYTLIIGILAVFFEGLRYLKGKFLAWFHQPNSKHTS
jgi:hypothetical protein